MRKNVTTWSDAVTLTKFQNELTTALIKYQMHAAPRDDGRWGVGALGGDLNVMVAAIGLRDRLNQLIERSKLANDSSNPR